MQPYIVSGELVETLSNYKAGGYQISVVYRQQQRLAPKVRVFMNFLVSLFNPQPWDRLQDGLPVRSARRRKHARQR